MKKLLLFLLLICLLFSVSCYATVGKYIFQFPKTEQGLAIVACDTESGKVYMWSSNMITNEAEWATNRQWTLLVHDIKE
jgi:hypothetical protein